MTFLISQPLLGIIESTPSSYVRAQARQTATAVGLLLHTTQVLPVLPDHEPDKVVLDPELFRHRILVSPERSSRIAETRDRIDVIHSTGAHGNAPNGICINTSRCEEKNTMAQKHLIKQESKSAKTDHWTKIFAQN